MYFLTHQLVWINDERMAVHCLESGCIGLYIPSDLKISSALEMSLGLRPRDISRASGNLLVVGDVLPNTSLLSAVYVYNIYEQAGHQPRIETTGHHRHSLLPLHHHHHHHYQTMAMFNS